MTINRGPTEALFELISDLFLSGSSTANKIGLTTGRIQLFGKQIIGKNAQIFKTIIFEVWVEMAWNWLESQSTISSLETRQSLKATKTLKKKTEKSKLSESETVF